LIDLHSHSNESDGSCSPARLVEEAVRAGVDVLGITDHDTFAGYDQALGVARVRGVELVCGIELSTKLHDHSVHLLGYFLGMAGWAGFAIGVGDAGLAARAQRAPGCAAAGTGVRHHGGGSAGSRARNDRAAALCRDHGGEGIPANYRQAFDDYLDESAKGYVYRHEPQFAEAVARILKAGGIASLAHPVRVKGDVAAMMPELCDAGLNAIEAYHSDHGPGKRSCISGWPDGTG